MTKLNAYDRFLRAKVATVPDAGFEISPDEIHPWLKPHARDIACWAIAGGRRAVFAQFGLHKTSIQLEIARIIAARTGRPFLIVAPLGVRQEFMRDARKLGIELRFIQQLGGELAAGVYLTNYESVRDGKLDVSGFVGVSLDEASVLRSFGSKTFGEFLFGPLSKLRYRFVATATPSPNDVIELLAYAAFLGVMDIGHAKTRFFKRNPEKADDLTLHPHKRGEFWRWCAGWGIFLEKPSDLGYSDEGYDLPGMEIHWHEVASEFSAAGEEKSGQQRLMGGQAIGMIEAAREKRDSLPARLAKLMELRKLDPAAHRIIWHDLEAERDAIERAIPGIATVWGTQDMYQRERTILRFSDGEIQELATKPVIAGSGCNFQRHCAWEIFFGIGFKFNDFIQAIHRLYRFLQTKTVRIDLIYTEREREVRRVLEQKWEQHKELMREMAAIIREFGLSSAAIQGTVERSLGVDRRESSGAGWRLANNDTVLETSAMADSSVHMVLTSIPFSTQYEYTPSFNDLGHTETNEHFWEQMDFLIPELFRVLKPGRVCAVHVKDRICPGAMFGLGFQTMYAFHCDAVRNFEKHGFRLIGMKTIVTDVVRENNQTYRLGYSEMCKDGSRMGCGGPEYLLLFRRPPTDSSNGYADEPVRKEKDRYSLGRWQLDAHGFARSSGNRLISPDDLQGLRYHQVYRLWREDSLSHVYDYEEHVRLCDALQERGMLPVDFMLVPPPSWAEDVWTDVTRMRTLNTAQSAAGREKHICPLQFDIVDRAIRQYTQEGETVYDPFVGIGTVVNRAVLMGREGLGVELNPGYFDAAVYYAKDAERKAATPSLFDLIEVEESEEVCA